MGDDPFPSAAIALALASGPGPTPGESHAAAEATGAAACIGPTEEHAGVAPSTPPSKDPFPSAAIALA